MRDSASRWHAATSALWLIALIAASSVAAGPDVAQQIPKADLPRWNRAYNLSITNFTQEQYPALLSAPCTDAGFDSDPTTVALGACFFRREADGTYSYWSKRPGDWREDSNCYCYALNVYKGGFCIPGVTNPQIDAAIKNRDTFTCDLLRQAVTYDGAKEVMREVAISSQPATGHFIALMVRSDSCNPHHCWRNDFHAARKDADGFWTWKEPGGPASDKDLFGNKITDPSIAVLPGHYDQFCGFWWVDPATLTIGGVFTEQSLQDLVKYYKQTPGVQASVEPLPYSPVLDGAYDAKSQAQLNEDVDWENQRGTKAWQDYYRQQSSGQVDTVKLGDDPVVTPINLNSGRSNVGQLNIEPIYGRVNVNAALGRTNAGNLGRVNKGALANTGSLADRVSLASSSSSVVPGNSSPLVPPSASNSSGANSSSSSSNASSSLGQTIPQIVPTSTAASAGSSSGVALGNLVPPGNAAVPGAVVPSTAPGMTSAVLQSVAASSAPGSTATSVTPGSTLTAGTTPGTTPGSTIPAGSTLGNSVTAATNNPAAPGVKSVSSSSSRPSSSNVSPSLTNAAPLPSDVSTSNTSTPQMQQALLKAAAAAATPLPATAAASSDSSSSSARAYDSTSATFQSIGTSGRLPGGDATAAAASTAANSRRKEAAAVVQAAAAATNQQLLRGNSASSSTSSSGSSSARLQPKVAAGGRTDQPVAARLAPVAAVAAVGGRRELRERRSQRIRHHFVSRYMLSVD